MHSICIAEAKTFVMFFQLGLRKRLVFGTLVVFAIVFPAYVTATASIGTDIIGGMCMPLIAFRSEVEQQAINVTMSLFTYALPTALMVFCYSRIIYTLTHKVGGFASLNLNL